MWNFVCFHFGFLDRLTKKRLGIIVLDYDKIILRNFATLKPEVLSIFKEPKIKVNLRFSLFYCHCK